MKQTNQNASWPNQAHESKSFENYPTRDFHMECSLVRCEKTYLGWQSCMSLFTFTRGRGLTLTSAGVLVRALIDGPGLQPTDTVDLTKCAVRALVPTVAVRRPHVYHRQETGQSPLARTCSTVWALLSTPPHFGALLGSFFELLTTEIEFQKMAKACPWELVFLTSSSTHVLRPAGRPSSFGTPQHVM